MLHLPDVIGFVASAISFILWLPQAVLVWRSRRDPAGLGTISLWTQLLLVLNASLWGVYAVLEDAFWVGAPGLINAPLAILTIVIVLRSRRTSAAVDACCGHCGWDLPGEHRIFITAPPGYGALMPCGATTARHGVAVPAEQPELAAA